MCNCSGENKYEIVNELANNKPLMKELTKILQNKEYANDIIQDIFLQMLEKEPTNKLISLCKNNEMKFFLISIIKNQQNNKNSIYKKYLDFDYKFFELEQQNEKQIDYIKFDNIVKKELKKLSIYQQEIFNLVVNSDKTYKQLEKKVNIKDYSIKYTFAQVKKILQKKLKAYDF